MAISKCFSVQLSEQPNEQEGLEPCSLEELPDDVRFLFVGGSKESSKFCFSGESCVDDPVFGDSGSISSRSDTFSFDPSRTQAIII